MPFRHALREGFTLIELLVVIGIIAVLSTILLLQLGTARSKTRDTQRITAISQLRGAIESYLDDYGQYPTATTFTAAAFDKYIHPLPQDPLSSCAAGVYADAANCYGYSYNTVSNVTSHYRIAAQLENFNKPALGNDSDVNTSSWTGGVKNDGSSAASTEKCTASVAATQGTWDCMYDLGQ